MAKINRNGKVEESHYQVHTDHYIICLKEEFILNPMYTNITTFQLSV